MAGEENGGGISSPAEKKGGAAMAADRGERVRGAARVNPGGDSIAATGPERRAPDSHGRPGETAPVGAASGYPAQAE